MANYITLQKMSTCVYQPIETNKNKKIDFVFSYVNSRDKGHIQKLKTWYEKEGRYVLPNKQSSFEDRYIDFNELFFSIMFLKKFATFIRYIFIVTPTPNIIRKYYHNDEQIKIIEDCDIIPPEIISPCFRSTVIESFLHKIPEISEFFLYGCDDMFIGNKLNMKDLLSHNNVPKVYLESYYLDYDNPNQYKKEAFKMDIFNSNILIRDKFKILPSLCHNHQIVAYRRDVCEITHNLFREAIYLNGSHRFRYPTDNNLHFAILQNFVGVLYGYYDLELTSRGKECSIGFYPYNSHNPWKRFYRILSEKPKFFCLNFIQPEYMHYYYHLFIQYFSKEINTPKKFLIITKEKNIFKHEHFKILSDHLSRFGDVTHGFINNLPQRLCLWKINRQDDEIFWKKSNEIENSNIDKIKIIYVWMKENKLQNFIGNENYDIQTANINYIPNIIPEINYFSCINVEETVEKKNKLYYKHSYKDVIKHMHNIIFRTQKEQFFDMFTEKYPKKRLCSFQKVSL